MDIDLDISFCLTEALEPEQLRRFLEQIESHSDPVAYEVVVAAGGYKPDSPLCRDLQVDFPNLVFLEPPAAQRSAILRSTLPPSRGGMVNRAFGRARGRYLALWSSKVVPLAGCLPTLVEFLDEETETALAAPRLVDREGRTIPSARRFPDLATLLLLHSLLGRSGLGGPLLKVHYYADRPPVLSQAAVEFLPDLALLIRRVALEEIGLFDEGFNSLYADADYCRRARRLGWYCHYLAGALAREEEPERHLPDYLLRHPQVGHLADATRLLLKKWLRV